jgi:hypothetical protein
MSIWSSNPAVDTVAQEVARREDRSDANHGVELRVGRKESRQLPF